MSGDLDDLGLARREVLREAEMAVCRHRNDPVAPAEDSFLATAKLWSAYLGRDVTPVQVCAMMILLKVARSTLMRNRDNWTDVAGYAACASSVEPGQ